MKLLRPLLPLLGLVLAAPALAQTTPAQPKRTVRFTPRTTRMVPNTTPAARAADPLRGRNDNGKGQDGYAAPGQPINVQDNGKQTPPYDGPAAGHATPSKGMTMPRKP